MSLQVVRSSTLVCVCVRPQVDPGPLRSASASTVISLSTHIMITYRRLRPSPRAADHRAGLGA